MTLFPTTSLRLSSQKTSFSIANFPELANPLAKKESRDSHAIKISTEFATNLRSIQSRRRCANLSVRGIYNLSLYVNIHVIYYRKLVDSEQFSPEAITEIGLWKSNDSHRNYYKISTTIRRKSSNVIVDFE